MYIYIYIINTLLYSCAVVYEFRCVYTYIYIYTHTLLVDLCQRARRTPFELTSDKFVFWWIVVVCEPTNTSSQTDFNCPKERHFFTTNIHQQSLLIHIHQKKHHPYLSFSLLVAISPEIMVSGPKRPAVSRRWGMDPNFTMASCASMVETWKASPGTRRPRHLDGCWFSWENF